MSNDLMFVNRWPPFRRSGTTITQRIASDDLASTGNMHHLDDKYFRMGNVLATPDAILGWNTTQTVDALFLGLSDVQNVFIIAEKGDVAYDFAHGAQTNPTLYIQSATQSATQWLSLAHNQTDGIISTGAGALKFAPATKLIFAPITTGVLFDFQLETEWTTGIIINADFGGATTQTNDMIGILLDFNTNLIGAPSRNINGYIMMFPTLTQSTADSTTYTGYNFLAVGALVQDTLAGTINWRGINLTLPATTQTTGTINAYGVFITGGINTSSTTYTGIEVVMNAATDMAVWIAQGTTKLDGVTAINMGGSPNTYSPLTVGWNNSTMAAATTAARHLYMSGNITELAGAAITDIVGAYFNTFTITDGGGVETVGIVSTVYIPNAPTVGTTPTNGPYALFVDSGNVRLDGYLDVANATFTPGADTNAVSISPTFTAENFYHRGLNIQVTQNGANTQGTRGISINMIKATAATTLVNMAGLVFNAPSVAGTVTSSEAIQIQDQANGSITTGRAIRIIGTGAQNAIELGDSPIIYSNTTNNIRLMDAANTRGIAFDLTAAGDQKISNAIGGNLVLAPITGTSLAITPVAWTSGTANAITITPAANTAITVGANAPQVTIATSTQTWATGAIAEANYFQIAAPTFAAAAASVISQAGTLTVTAAPIAGGNVTITAGAAFWAKAGQYWGAGGTVANPTYSFAAATGAGMYEDGRLRFAHLGANIFTAAADGFYIQNCDGLNVTTRNSNAPTTLLLLTPYAVSASNTGAERTDISLVAKVQTWATGALANQRYNRFDGHTAAFAGASLITNFTNFWIDTPNVGTNGTVTTHNALQVGGDFTVNQTAATVYGALGVPSHTATIGSLGTQITSTGFSAARLGIVTLTSGTATTVDSSSTLYIAGPVAAAGSVTLTNPYAMWVDAGNSRFDGLILQAPTTTGILYDIALETEWTTGTLINADFAGATVQSGDMQGIILDFNTNLAGVTDHDIVGYIVELPALTQSTANTTNYIGFILSTAGALVQNLNAGAINWMGMQLQMPNITQTTGAVEAIGLNIIGGVVTSGEANGIYINMNAATDTAIWIDQGYLICDNIIYPNEDIVFDNATKGIILKDTQGSPHYWRVTVDNSGALIVTDTGTTKPT